MGKEGKPTRITPRKSVPAYKPLVIESPRSESTAEILRWRGKRKPITVIEAGGIERKI